MKRSKLYQLREIIEKASVNLSDEDALSAVELFPAWEVGKDYTQNDRILYNGHLYKVNQSHTSQADWSPDTVPALFSEVAMPGEIPVWKQPIGSSDAYNKGDQVHYPTADDPVYESLIDGNVWSPEAYPQGWEQK